MQCQKLRTYMETGRVMFLPARSIRPNPAQPRSVFREDALEELADSIRQHGILQPLSVRRTASGYELIAGERRLRAARMVGLGEIPCIVMNMDDKESGLAAMVENLQRQDLDFVEEAKGISRIMSDWAMSQEQAARMLGKSQSAIANKLRLLRHSDRVLDALRTCGLTERHGRALLKLEQEEAKLSAIEEIVRQGMSVARTERYIQELLEGQQKSTQKVNVGAFLNSLNQSLAKIQLARAGAGRRPGLMRNFLADENCSAKRSTVVFSIADYVGLAGEALHEYQVHMRYILVDTLTGYRSCHKSKSFQISI